MNQRRQYSRVDAKISLSVRLLAQGEAAAIRPRAGEARPAGRDFPVPPDHGDAALNQWLRMLNAKLDALLELHSGEFSSDLKPCPVNIGAGGMMFPSSAGFKLGDKIEARMELPMKRPVPVAVAAEVVRVCHPFVAVKFINMEEDVTQKIADFVFFREREILMARRM